MTESWERIIAIVDSAAPVEAPEIPLAVSLNKRAPRQRRSDRSSASAANSASSLPTASLPVHDPAVPPSQPHAPANAPEAAAAPAVRGVIVSFRTTSQKGGSAAGNAAAESGGAGRPPAGVARDAGDDDDGLNLRLAFYPHTDLGNAERFRERFRGKLLWCPALGWLWWDGKRWSRDGAEEKVKLAEHHTVRAIQDEAQALFESGHDVKVGSKYKGKPDEETIMMSDSLAAWGRASEQANRLSPIAKRAAPYLAVAPEQLDADPFKFNVANGTLVFRKAEGSDYVTFKPHDQADMITKCSAVVYDPKAPAAHFDSFLVDVQPEAARRRFLMQWQGLSLTGDITEQKLCIFWGKGRNGKSTFIDACACVAGDYGETVPIETFLNEGRSRNAGQATPDLAMLPGVRYLYTSEPNKGAKLDEALIKLATGGDAINARHLNKEYFRFRPQFKLTISGNYRPSISGSDEGIWRRPQLVPWDVTIDKAKVDKHLVDKLRAEASGILNRLLDGLRDWFDHGLVPPESVIEATADYRRDSDPLGRFLEACVEPAAGQRVQSSDMHALFGAWAKANGATEWSPKGLANALKERGFHSKHSNVMWWLDVKLIHSVSDYVDHEGKPLKGESRPSQAGDDDDAVRF
jgi:putative DNA primase/helicase